MIHLTLNTGHSRESPRSEVSDVAIAACRGLLRPGNHGSPLPPGYRLEVLPCPSDIWFGTIYAPGGRPVVTIGVARGDGKQADAAWDAIENHYLAITDRPPLAACGFAAPKQPTSTPWVAAILALPTTEEAGWIADFERCAAWAFVESGRRTADG